MQQGYNPYTYYNPQAYPPPYGQQPPPQQPPHNPYGPYYAPPNPSQGPQPYTFDAAAYTQYPQQDATQSRRQRKHHSFTAAPAQFSAPTPAPPPAPALKSAMKKTMNIFQSADTAMGRQLSYPGQATESRPQTRQRTYSNPARPLQRRESMYNHDQPDSRDLSGDPVTFHMMVSFHSYNELHLEHVYAKALEDIRNIILPIWKDGIESDTILNHTCVIKFRNAPWDMGGPNVKQAYELIKGFFRLTQHKGYSFQTAIGMTTSSPRLIFQVTQPDERAEFFIAFFSQEGRKLTLVDPPGHIDLSIGARLRSAFPYKISSDNVVEEKNRVIEIRRKASSNAPEIDQSVLFVEVLKVLNELNFQLDATIPLPRRGSLGMRSTRELLVFKGYVPQ